MRKIFGALFAILCVIVTALGVCPAADNDIVWQIGTCDASWREFGLAGRYGMYKKEFPGGAAFEVGKGDPAKNWVYVQPGPTDEPWAGPGEHPYEVLFDFNEQPTDLYAIVITLVDTNPSNMPKLQVRINDWIQSFSLKNGASKTSLFDPSAGRMQSLKVYVPGGFLHKGRNVLNLTIKEGGWILYDYLSMYKCVNEYAPHAVSNVSVESTLFFKKHDNELKQIIAASMDVYEHQDNIRVQLASEKGWQVDQEFKNLASGRQSLEIEVPPVKVEQKAHLKIFAGDEVQEADVTIQPQRQWTLYLMPLAHFDHGYTHIQNKTLEIHRENTDKAMDWFAKYPGFVWNSENAMLAEDYLLNGSRKDDFLKWAKQGRLGVQALYANMLTGICSGEELSSVVDFYDTLRRNYGISCSVAVQDDVPSMVGTVPMILQGHGVKYFAHRVNPCRGPFNQLYSKSPFYWQSPDGSKVLSWITTDQTWGMEMTDEGNINRTSRMITQFLEPYTKQTDYPYDAILVFGAYLDNDTVREQLASVREKWEQTYEYPKLVYSRGDDFFKYIEVNYAKQLKTYKGDGGVYWEDGAISSAHETAITRISKEKLTTAEKLISLCDARYRKQVKNGLATAWKNIYLYDEHTWGAGGSVTDPNGKQTLAQWTVKKSFADKAARASDDLLRQAIDKLCSKVRVKEDSIVVFNPSGWLRSEWIDIELPSGETRSLYADSVPAMGYKAFPVKKLQRNVPDKSSNLKLENKYYKIEFSKDNTGAITSIYDKDLKRELVDPSKYGFNCYLYCHGGQYSESINFTETSLNNLKIDVPNGAYYELKELPGRHIVKAICKAPMTSGLSTEVVLYDNEKRIDFINTMDKTETTEKEAGYFAFPFAFKKPSVRVEIPDGVIRPEADQLPGACRDWYAAQHFVTISDGSASVAWTAVDSPLLTLGDVNRAQWYKHLDIENGNLFSYIFNNYWFTNYKASQGGPLTFRYSMTSGRNISDIQAKKFGESLQSPMVWKRVAGKPGVKTDSPRSFINLEGKGVVLQAMKPARFSNGTVIRLREMNGQNTTARLSIRGISFKRAYLCNLAEDRLSILQVKNGIIEVPCKALGLATVVIE